MTTAHAEYLAQLNASMHDVGLYSPTTPTPTTTHVPTPTK
jgi:hypothetical protein